MATPFEYSDAGLWKIGKTWFAGVKANRPEAEVARKALARRGHDAAPARRGLATQAARGEQLYAEFVSARAARSQSRTATRLTVVSFDDAASPLRQWVRDQHGIAVAVKRDEDAPALSALPTLSELATESGLETSSRAMIEFLGLDAVVAVLSPYGVDADEVARGKQLRDALHTASKRVSVGRGARGAATGEHMSARDAFASWLAKWWGIAKIDLGVKAPRSLAALGVETAALRPAKRPRKGGQPSQVAQPK